MSGTPASLATVPGPGVPQCLFCYGTLQIPAVLEAVIGRPLEGGPARLPGYAIFRVRGEVYPGIARTTGGSTPGRLYRAVTPQELAVLDRFEGRLYRRTGRVVITPEGRRSRAWVYQVTPGREAVLTRTPWHLRAFRRNGYHRFMQRFVQDRRALYAPEGPNPAPAVRRHGDPRP